MNDGKDPLRYFRIEAKEISEDLGRSILQLERGPSPETVIRLLRLAHTLKGAAGIVRQRAIAEHAHALEDALDPHREHTENLGSAEYATILARVDAITALVAGIEKPQGQARQAAVEEPLDVIHAETDDVDAILGSIKEAGVRLRNLRAVSDLALRAGRLCDCVNESFVSPPTFQSGTHTVDALRDLITEIERQLISGIDLADREMRQAQVSAERLRLLPCRAMLTALERAARNAAQECGKQVTFESGGGAIRADAGVLFTVQRALVQLVRNSVAHGIETPQARVSLGKPASGRIVLEIACRGGQISFVCRDDGAGIDLAAARDVARQRNIPASQVEAASADELLQTLLRGGFSTAKSVTEISGRGIGLDIAREAAAQLGGRLNVGSEVGKGTWIEVIVPAALSAVEALLVECRGTEYAIPLLTVRRTLRLATAEVTQLASGTAIVDEKGLISLVKLADLLAAEGPPRAAAASVLIVDGTSASVALAVDRILGVDDVVVRSLSARMAADPMVSGLTFDAEGVPRLLLDADGLIGAVSHFNDPGAIPDRAPLKHILVIDDSLTTRALESSILESAGYVVDQANSAEEGLKKARAHRYGLFLVDVEMLGMGGFAFVRTIRADPDLRDVPAILVTSRDAPEDRRLGLDAGANDYVVKGEFNQNRFLTTVRNLLEAV